MAQGGGNWGDRGIYLMVYLNIANIPAATCCVIVKAPTKEAWALVMLEETFLFFKCIDNSLNSSCLSYSLTW